MRTGAILACLLVSAPVRAGIGTANLYTQTPADLVNALVGSGIVTRNITYLGASVAAGTFIGGAPVGFDTGILLSTGNIASVTGPNLDSQVSTQNVTGGDAQLSAIAGAATADAAVLEFDFKPSGSILSFDYVFASDEYNEFIHDYHDVFAFFLDGVNIALVPGTSTPVSVNTVNLSANAAYFRNNDVQMFGAGKTPVDTEMDGLTTVLTVAATVTPGVWHHIKLAIADASDNAVDSNVFIRSASFRIPAPEVHLIKRAPAKVNVGGSCTFSLTVSVTGDGSLDGVTVWDTVPAGTTFVSATGGGVLDWPIVVWSLGSLPGGTVVPLAFTVTLGGSLAPLWNRAAADGSFGGTPEGLFLSNWVTVTVVRGEPMVTLVASSAGPVCAGDALTWTLGWSNAGAGTTWGLTLTDTLPAGVRWAGPAEAWAQGDWLGAPQVTVEAWASDAAGPWTAGEPPAGTEPAVVRWVVDRVAPGRSGFIRFRTTMSPTPPPSGLVEGAASATQPWDSAVRESYPVTIPTGGSLEAAVAAFPAVVNTGRTFMVTLTVTNSGCADAVTPSLWGPMPTGTGGAAVAAGPSPAVPASIAAGSHVTFTWTMTATLAGDVTCAASVAATDGYNTLPLLAGPVSSANVHISRPAALVASLAVSPSAACTGETAVVTLTVTNTGETGAVGVAPGPLTAAGPGSVGTGPFPSSPVTIPGGGSAAFAWTVNGSSTGAVAWTATVGGLDARTSDPVAAGPAGALESILTPGSLVAALSVPPMAAVGQWVTIALTVTHAGGTPVTGVAPAGLAWPSGLGAVKAGPSPGPATLSAGASRTFTWTFSVSGAGTIAFSSTGAGTTCTGPVLSPVAAASIVAVAPAALAGAIALSSPVVVAGEWITATLTLTNTGGDNAVGVIPSLGFAGAAGTFTNGPVPASVPTLGPGLGTSFVWTFSTSGAGTVTFTGGGGATDALSGRAVAAPAAYASLTVLAPAHLSLVAFALSPGSPATGDPVAAILTVRNDGGTAANVTGVAASATAPLVLGVLTGPSPGPPVTLGAGASVSFAWSATAVGCGFSAATATVTGVEVATGRSLGMLHPVAAGVSVHGAPVLLALAASPATAPAATTVTLVATLRDACGLPVPDRTLVFTVSTGGGTVAPVAGATDSSGEARVTLTLGIDPGPNSVAVTLASPALSATAVVVAGRGLMSLTTPGGGLSRNAFSPWAGETVLVRMFLMNNDPVRVRIYTASGRLVRVLRNTRPIGGGQVMVVWDGRTEDEFPVARGVYIIKVDGGGIRETLKVVVR